MYCLAHFSLSAFFSLYKVNESGGVPILNWLMPCLFSTQKSREQWKVLIFCSYFCFLNFAHCNLKFQNDKEKVVFFFCCCWQNFLSPLPLFCQLTARKTVFTATAWPPTPASVNRAGEGRTVLAVSPPAAAVCDKERLSLWDWCSPLCLLARGENQTRVSCYQLLHCSWMLHGNRRGNTTVTLRRTTATTCVVQEHLGKVWLHLCEEWKSFVFVNKPSIHFL